MISHKIVLGDSRYLNKIKDKKNIYIYKNNTIKIIYNFDNGLV